MASTRARLAKDFPRDVRLVITLGTPFTGHPKATNAWRLYELVTGHRIGAPEIHEPLRDAPPVPTTSIYSRTDGVVAWQCSVERRGAHAENIEVEASHLGIGLNRAGLVRDCRPARAAGGRVAALRSERRAALAVSRPDAQGVVLELRSPAAAMPQIDANGVTLDLEEFGAADARRSCC